MILCGLHNQVKTFKIYHHEEEQCKADMKKLKKCMLMIAKADNLVTFIMKNEKCLDQLIQRHLNVSPEDAQFLSSYVEG